MKRSGLFGLAAAVTFTIFAGSTSRAQAQGFCGGWGGWGTYGLYNFDRTNAPYIPYYSLFPPVYYSMPVPRTYGWSPFAYPPGTMTPEIEMELPGEIINPHVQPNPGAEKTEAKPSAVRTAAFRAPQPQVLINPYVKAFSTASVK